MKPPVFSRAILPLFFFAASFLSAQAAIPEPDPQAETFAARGPAFDWRDYAEISLWASTAGTGTGWEPHLRRLTAAAEELVTRTDLPQETRARGEYVLTFAHGKFLKTYQATQTRIDEILSGGKYNCVSSAVLYLILGTAAGLEIHGVITRDHAFARLRDGETWIDIETTNPYGFDPGNRKEFQDNFGKTTGFVYVPARDYRERTPISPLELISLIYHNRVADLTTKSRFAETLPLARNNAALLRGRKDPAPPGSLFPDPGKDLLDCVFNYGSTLIKAGEEPQALRFAAENARRFPAPERWETFAAAAMNNLTVKLIKTGKYAQARAALAEHAPLLTPAESSRLTAALSGAELAARSLSMRAPSEAEPLLAAVNQALADGHIGEERAEELRTYIITRAAGFLAARRDWPGAIAFTEAAITRWGTNRALETSLTTLRENRHADIHNAFAAAYNRRDFTEAARVIETGLEEFPGSRQLLRDKAILENR